MAADTYRSIIAACFPDLAIHSCDYASQGWDSVAVVVNGALIFRFPRRPEVEPQYLMEARLLHALAGRVSLPLPRFAYVWHGGAPCDRLFVGYPMLGGEQLRRAMLAALDERRLAEQLGGFLTDLHAFPTKQAERLGVPGGDTAEWQKQYRQLYARIQALVFPLLGAPLERVIAARWQAFLEDDANFQFQPALVHHDLTGDHILVERGGGVSGIIDWGDASIGDPAIDFTGLLDDYGAEFAERVLASYGGAVDATFMKRAVFYRLVMPFHEVLFGLDTSLREHVEQGLEGVRVRWGA
jgi:aminoglycoside 2''-phosphotransferase